ncbi:hypothetical protein PMKS-001918 [Pichia membranifaciens]|uniref:Nucleolar 27S pre-rRNA processing Urb2/Npa2 C-terminal domain-containing protein n=1 Tax=Pichia membranifaciens TaxID=4926 RepID=A0A1Q2YFW1_9ASCO|nr:hypothetical protein PMKS-001918 [Pichia membranifaciens]
MLCKNLFSEDDKKAAVTFIGQFAGVESNNSLNSDEVIFLLKLVIPKVGVQELESIVQTLMGFYPSYSTQLLKHVTDMNKTLSTEFLSSVVEKELHNDKDISFELIIHCIRRNADVTFKYSDEICKLCSTGNPQSVMLFKEFFDSYVKTREVESFIKKWSALVQAYPGNIFDSDEMIGYASLTISALSYTQLSKLFEIEVESYTQDPNVTPIFLLSACKGMMKAVSGSIQNALSKTLIENMYQLKPMLSTLLKTDSDCSWKLKFFILNLFDVEELEEEAKILLGQRHSKNDYYFYAILRILEQDISQAKPKFLQKFISYFKKQSSNNFRKTIFCRWFRLVEALFNKDEIKELIKKFMKYSTDKEITEVLQIELFDSQPNIILSFVETFLASNSHLKFCQYVSAYALTKKQKVQVLDNLLGKLNDKEVPNAKQIMLNLITLPTFKSKLETDFDSLLHLATYCDSDLNQLIKIVISNHLKQPVESANYLDGAFATLTKQIDSFNKKKCAKKIQYLSVASILITESIDSSFEEKRMALASNSITKIMDILSETPDLPTVTVSGMIKFLVTINYSGDNTSIFPSNVKDVISKLGLKYSDDKSFKSLLFGLVCSMDKFYRPEYIFALFVVLNDDANIKYMELFVSSLAEKESVFIESWFSVCDSVKSASDEDFEKYTELCAMLISKVKKSDDDTKLRITHVLFVHTISQIFTKTTGTTSFGNVCFLKCLKTVISTKIWLFTQYAMELTMAFVSFLSGRIQGPHTMSSESVKDIYCDLCQLLSSTVLYQRRRLSNRHHLIISVLASLMRTLFTTSSTIATEGGLAFERLTSNLCEPNVGNLHVKRTSDSAKDAEVSNALSQTKAGLRKYIPVLILTYIKYYLQYKVDVGVKSYLDTASYMMLDLLTLNELNYINKSLDSQGRVVFKTLYEDYKKFYKWNEE